MNGRQRQASWIVLGSIVFLAVLMFTVKKSRYDQTSGTWGANDPAQAHSEGAGAGMGTLTDAQSLAANGVTSMSSCCTGYTAGLRTRKTYPGTLLECPDSLIHVGIDAGVNL